LEDEYFAVLHRFGDLSRFCTRIYDVIGSQATFDSFFIPTVLHNLQKVRLVENQNSPFVAKASANKASAKHKQKLTFISPQWECTVVYIAQSIYGPNKLFNGGVGVEKAIYEVDLYTNELLCLFWISSKYPFFDLISYDLKYFVIIQDCLFPQ
jgi:hypothetical protein